MKKIKNIFSKLIPLLGIFGVLYIFFLLSQPTYLPGECAIDEANYIWRISGFSRFEGTYKAKGWQLYESEWGKEVDLEREILENDRYKPVICPDPTIFKDVNYQQE